MGHSGAVRELLVPDLGSSGQKVFALLAVVAGGERVNVDVGCGSAVLAGVESSLGDVGLTSAVEASEEADAVSSLGLVEATDSDSLPRAVRFFDASSRWVTDGRSQLPCDGVVRSEVVEDLGEVPGAELPAPGSSGSEVVLHGDLRFGSRGGGQDEGGEQFHVEAWLG